MTEYYGNTSLKRVETVACYEYSELCNNTYPIGFIFGKGMLFDYAVNRYYNGFVDHCKQRVHPSTCPDYSMKNVDNLERIEKDGKVYYVGNMGYENHGSLEGEMYYILKETAMINSDRNFNWKKNVRYDSYEATLTHGMFDFVCTYNASGDAYIDVRYTKCENKHRTKVSIGAINVYYASNETILQAINAWKEEFKKNMDIA